MEKGDVLGHEPMGIVEEVGKDVTRLKKGDRVVVPFTISCGTCWYCKRSEFSLCDTSNPNAETARKAMGQSPAGLFGYSHMLGGYRRRAGRISPRALSPTSGRSRSSRTFPTKKCSSSPTFSRPATWPPRTPASSRVTPSRSGDAGRSPSSRSRAPGCSGAGRVIAIDRVPERLAMAEKHGKAETINFAKDKVYDRLMEMTKGRGPDRCIDAVGCEAHGSGSFDAVVDKAKAAIHLATDRAHVLREAIMCCRKGGTVSIPGVYFGCIGQDPFGAVMNKGLTIKAGQTHVQRYGQKLLKKIRSGEIDPSFVITHTRPLSDAPEMYKTFRDKKDDCIKVVLKP